MSVVAEDMDDWKEYHDQQLGFGIKYPRHYFHDPQHTTYLSLRQNTTSAEECRTLGKRIGVHVRQLRPGMAFDVAGCLIELTGDTTLADIERQFLAADSKDDRPAVRRTCHRRNINGTPSLICTLRAPGEAPELTGGIFEVFVLGIHDLADGKRMLVQMDNTAGGTPYTIDRQLRRDVLWICHTLRWTSSSTP